MRDAFHVRNFLHDARKAVGVLFFFSILINLLFLSVPIYMLQLYDRVLPSRMSDTLFFLTLMVVTAIVTLGILMHLRTQVMMRVGSWFDRRVSRDVMQMSIDQTLMGNPMAATLIRDVMKIRQFISSQGCAVFFDMPWIPIYLFVVFLLHPYLGLLGLVGAFFLGMLSILNERNTRGISFVSQELSQQRMSTITSALRNAEVISGLGMLPNLMRHWDTNNEQVLQASETMTRKSHFYLACAKVIRLLLQISILGVGGYLAMQGVISAGVMIVASIIVGKGVQPLEQSIGSWTQFMQARTSYNSLKGFLDQPHREFSSVAHDDYKGVIHIDALFYLYPRAKEFALSSISLQVPSGAFLSLIGPTGSGKTTLCKLLVGAFIPTRGSIRLDDVEVSNWDRENFGRLVGYIPQHGELLMGSVRENIARFDPEATDEQVIEAAKKAGCHEMILHLPKGYETKISADGRGVSGGQLQRIGLARCFYGNPRWMILDEPDSFLDSEGEAALLHAIEQAKKHGITLVLVSQKKRYLELSDYTLVLRDGKPVLFGKSQEVRQQMMGGAAAHA